MLMSFHIEMLMAVFMQQSISVDKHKVFFNAFEQCQNKRPCLPHLGFSIKYE